jgi:hypothetical protein
MDHVKTPESQWNRNAAHWQLLGSPLRPTTEDILLYQRALQRWSVDHGDPAHRILLLGVTQELRGMDWPADAELVACDGSRAMIESIWPCASFAGATSTPVCADWGALPLRSASRNIAIGDGCALLLSIDDLRRVAANLDRVLDQDATLILRLFMRPKLVEGVDAVVAAANAGEIGSFHAFKWRLAMALQGTKGTSVRLANVWDTFASLFPDRHALAWRTGWPVEIIHTIDSYHAVHADYHYHRLEEFVAALQPVFSVVSVEYPAYELGERCPVIAVRRSA